MSNAEYILILSGCFPMVVGLVSHGGNSNLRYCVITHQLFRYSTFGWFFQESLKPEEKMPHRDFSHSGPWVFFFTDPWRRKCENIWHLTSVYVFLNSRIGAISVRFLSICIVFCLFILYDDFCLFKSWFIIPCHIIEYDIFDSDSRPSQSPKFGCWMGLPKPTTLKGPGLISENFLERNKTNTFKKTIQNIQTK